MFARSHASCLREESNNTHLTGHSLAVYEQSQVKLIPLGACAMQETSKLFCNSAAHLGRTSKGMNTIQVLLVVDIL